MKSQDGFLFQGHLGHTAFAFDIPGDEIQVAEQQDPGDPARMAIDNVFFAVMRVSKSDFPSTDPNVLISYRKSEQQYEREQFSGVRLSDLDVCEDASLNHESWVLDISEPKAPTQAYMAIDAGNDLIVVSSAFTNAEEKGRMLSKFSSALTAAK